MECKADNWCSRYAIPFSVPYQLILSAFSGCMLPFILGNSFTFLTSHWCSTLCRCPKSHLVAGVFHDAYYFIWEDSIDQTSLRWSKISTAIWMATELPNVVQAFSIALSNSARFVFPSADRPNLSMQLKRRLLYRLLHLNDCGCSLDKAKSRSRLEHSVYLLDFPQAPICLEDFIQPFLPMAYACFRGFWYCSFCLGGKYAVTMYIIVY